MFKSFLAYFHISQRFREKSMQSEGLRLDLKYVTLLFAQLISACGLHYSPTIKLFFIPQRLLAVAEINIYPPLTVIYFQYIKILELNFTS